MAREHIEHGEHSPAARLDGGGQVGAPPLQPPAQHRDDEVALAGEVPVERRAPDTRLGQQPLHPDRADALGVEEALGGGDQAVAGGGGHGIDPSAEQNRSVPFWP